MAFGFLHSPNKAMHACMHADILRVLSIGRSLSSLSKSSNCLFSLLLCLFHYNSLSVLLCQFLLSLFYMSPFSQTLAFFLLLSLLSFSVLRPCTSLSFLSFSSWFLSWISSSSFLFFFFLFFSQIFRSMFLSMI